MSSTGAVLTAVAADGLVGSALTLPDAPLPSDEWLLLLERVGRQRIPGLLMQAIDGGRMAATPDQISAAARVHSQSMGTSVSLERLLVRSVGALDRAGVEHRVLKGPAVAHLVYPDPALRSFQDVDILVSSGAFAEAAAVLGREGCRRANPRMGPGSDDFGKGATLVTDEGFELDLHRSFVGGRFGLAIRLDDLFATSSPFELGGRTLLGLGPEEQFVHACYHAAIGDPTPRLVALRDIAEMLLHTPLDLVRVQALCSAWGGEAVMARAVRATWETLGLADLTALSVWAERYQPSRSDEKAVRAYTSERSGGRQALGSLTAIPGIRAKASFIRAVALPEREFLDHATTRRYGSWWRRGLRAALGRGRRG